MTRLKKDNICRGRKRLSVSAQDIGAWTLLIPFLILLFVFGMIPKINSVVWSFFNMNGYKLGEFVGLDNFRRVIQDTAFLQTLTNTFLYVFWSILIGYFLPIIIAMVLNEMVYLRSTLRIVVYLPSALPGVATMMLWYFMFYPDAGGMLNTLLGYFGIEPYVWLQDSRFTILYIILASTWSGAGATAIYYFSALQGVSRELYEAALIDGAGFFRRIRTVAVPHISGFALLLLIRQIMSVFAICDQPMQMTGGGPNNASMSLGLLLYRYGFVSIKPQLATAVGMIMFMILLVFTIIYFKVDKKLESNQM